MADQKKKRSDRQREAPREGPLHGAATSKWEWVSAAIGLLLVLGTVGFLGYKAVATDPFVPDVTIDHIGTVQASNGYVVRFRASNSGPTTAAALTISGRLHQGSTVIEESEVVLDYLPPRAYRQGGLVFRNDPAEYELSLEAEGYADP